MLELPISAKNDISHVSRADMDVTTFRKSASLDVPCQWSTSLGVGLQYDFAPHIGVYLEPSLQYFFHDGSDIKTYRTEHPLQVTLPLGIRFHW
jgi:RNA polymerase sigma-70 factor (ECF subfamily)